MRDSRCVYSDDRICYHVIHQLPECDHEARRIRVEMICKATGEMLVRVTIYMKDGRRVRVGWWPRK